MRTGCLGSHPFDPPPSPPFSDGCSRIRECGPVRNEQHPWLMALVEAQVAQSDRFDLASRSLQLTGCLTLQETVSAARCGVASRTLALRRAEPTSRMPEPDASVLVSVSKWRTEPDHSGSSSQRPLG